MSRAGRTRQVALLRGINVGRAKQVDMALLRQVFEELGAAEVRIHLRSGNVVYTADTLLAAPLVEQAVERRTSVACSVIVLAANALAGIVAADPFAATATDPAKYLVTFLSARPEAGAAEVFEAATSAPNECRVIGQAVYLWCPQGVLAATGDARFWLRLGLTSTSRNWRTVTRLLEMTGE